ncbi:hypothetical protein Leryth_026448 [Lithospermum erythrorhizon]|nr:hypothetical protein Leryth_026448 [Lithospermum erythrorhizon]
MIEAITYLILSEVERLSSEEEIRREANIGDTLSDCAILRGTLIFLIKYIGTSCVVFRMRKRKNEFGLISKKLVPFSLPVTIDLMLQIARGMEYLHHKKIYHGELKPSNILIKGRNVSTDGYMQAKVSGFGLSSCISFTPKIHTTKENVQPSFIWYAPEVLAEQENSGNAALSHPTEKADVYSFGMVCFEVITGKVPFEDSHLQGQNMSRNIKAGERPLFPSNTPKYVTNLTKKCWHSDPMQRPSFSSICRILRYMKRFLVMSPDCNQLDTPMPQTDYNDIETGFLRCFPSFNNSEILQPVTQIPFHMFAYKVGEKDKEKSHHISRENSESGSDGASMCGEDNVINVGDPLPPPVSVPRKPVKSSSAKNLADVKSLRQSGMPKGKISRPPSMISREHGSMRMKSEGQLPLLKLKTRRKSGHLSDSELP